MKQQRSVKNELPLSVTISYVLQDMLLLVLVGTFLSVPLLTCICWQRKKNSSSVKHGGLCLKLWHWLLKCHRLPQPAALVCASLQRLQQQQEQPKDGTASTTAHPAANWGLRQGYLQTPRLTSYTQSLLPWTKRREGNAELALCT